MAIGDTVQAGLMRVDFSPIARAGEAQARANQAFGDAVGGVINKFYQKKKDKQEREEREQAYLKMGLSDEEAKAASRDKDLANQFINKMNADRNYSLEMEKFNQAGELRDLQVDQIRKSMELADEALISENQFLQTLPSLITSPQAQRQADIARPGLSALGNADARNRFMQAQLDDPRNQVPVMNLNDRDFLNQFKDDPQQIKRALAFIEKRRENQKPQEIARTITVSDGQGGFTQIGIDKAGNPVRDFGPPKPSGMYRTPEEARREEILVGRTKDAMALNKQAREDSNIAISQAQLAQQALKYLPETTGGLTDFVNELKVIGESLGIDLPEGYQKDMADIGAFRQLTGQFLFSAMANTKGSITEKEMKLFRQISPDIDNSRAANKLMLEIYVKAGERAKLRRDLIRDLQKKNVDPREIQDAIENFNDEYSLMDDIRSLPRKTNQNSPPQTQLNRSGVRGGNTQPSQGSQTSGGFQIKTR